MWFQFDPALVYVTRMMAQNEQILVVGQQAGRRRINFNSLAALQYPRPAAVVDLVFESWHGIPVLTRAGLARLHKHVDYPIRMLISMMGNGLLGERNRTLLLAPGQSAIDHGDRFLGSCLNGNSHVGNCFEVNLLKWYAAVGRKAAGSGPDQVAKEALNSDIR
ncbi:hypothetical protein BDZ91DRAFT_767764 [Kalaharituber pfeilii]|nr:hypothetical protein BDZ91DRAFT_767764 [Kalaharituber pfeilii]